MDLLSLMRFQWGKPKVELEMASIREREKLNKHWGQVLRETQEEKTRLVSRASLLREKSEELRARKARLEEEIRGSRDQVLACERRYVKDSLTVR